jgi:hypothetical protein
VELWILGPLEVEVAGRPSRWASPQHQIVLLAANVGGMVGVLALFGSRWHPAATVAAMFAAATSVSGVAEGMLGRGQARQRRRVPVARAEAYPERVTELRQRVTHIRDNIAAAHGALAPALAVLPYRPVEKREGRQAHRDYHASLCLIDANALLAMATRSLDEYDQLRASRPRPEHLGEGDK